MRSCTSNMYAGLESSWWQEPDTALYSAASSSLCREPKGVLFEICNTLMKLNYKNAFVLPEKILILSPDILYSINLTIQLKA